ncbi:hypothetical protein QA634_25895 [Methylobacterium sp. CB376]|nr:MULTISPECIES: hypothetical protein [Methylobacterium]WFT78672.1 hypothetical protein QA634_25895 [Methylobacterium nodulans]
MTLAMASAVEERTASTREVASPVVAVPQAARETGGSPRRCGRFR